MGYSYEWKREESASFIENGKVIRCKSENRAPTVAVSKELRILDDPSKASGDRLQTPGARSPGDQSREVHQSDAPSQENPGQAPGDRLHFPGVEGSGDQSHKVPERLQPFKEGLSGEPPPAHTMSRWYNL